jgi:hypothetical protein
VPGLKCYQRSRSVPIPPLEGEQPDTAEDTNRAILAELRELRRDVAALLRLLVGSPD